jgi:hypothetical protein
MKAFCLEVCSYPSCPPAFAERRRWDLLDIAGSLDSALYDLGLDRTSVGGDQTVLTIS